MRRTAKGPSDPGPRRGSSQAGDRVRQLLNLAAALTRAASSAAVSDSVSEVGATPLGMEVTVLSDSECLTWAQDVESLARVVQALQVQAAGEIARRQNAGRYEAIGARKPVELLVQSLRLGAGEASRRVRLAKATLPVPDAFTGEMIPAEHPLLGAAFTTGAISQDSALIINGFLDDAARLVKDELIDNDSYADIADLLVSAGRNEAPDHLRRIGARVMAHIDPDGQKPSKGDLIAKQGLFFRQARRGLIHFDGHMTIAQYEQLMVAIGVGVNPNRHTDINTINQPADRATTDTTTDPNTSTSTSTSTSPLHETGTGVPAGPDGSNAGQDTFLDHLGKVFTMFNTEHAGEAPWAPNSEPDSGKTAARDDFWPPAETANEKPAYRPPAMLNGALTSWGWARLLEEWEIPPRPAGAPANAIPPRFEGESWFWLPSDPAANTSQEYSNATADPNDEGNDEWIVEGIQIPHPGSGETLGAVETRDPDSSDRVTLDGRTYGQKLLDGLLDCVKLAARTGSLPINGGLKTQLIITTTQADLDRTDRAGTIFTSRSGPVPLSLFGHELCDAEITPLFCGEGQKILDVGRTRRLFTPPQRKILYARDLGCSFPDCRAHAVMTEAHHIIPWYEGGPTSIENGALLCAYHHSLMHTSDWTMELITGTPYFTAPYMVDPGQTPRRNNYHHGLTQNSVVNSTRYKA